MGHSVVLTLALSTLGIRTFLFSILSPCLSPSSGKSIRFPSDRNARRSDGFIRKPKGIRGSPVRYAMLAARSMWSNENTKSYLVFTQGEPHHIVSISRLGESDGYFP